jgi:hypothetical protein
MKGNAGSTPYLVRPWHKRMLEDAAAKVSAQRIENGVGRRDGTIHTLGGSADVQWEDGKIDDAQVVRSVHLQMEFSGACADICGQNPFSY